MQASRRWMDLRAAVVEVLLFHDFTVTRCTVLVLVLLPEERSTVGILAQVVALLGTSYHRLLLMMRRDCTFTYRHFVFC